MRLYIHHLEFLDFNIFGHIIYNIMIQWYIYLKQYVSNITNLQWADTNKKCKKVYTNRIITR